MIPVFLGVSIRTFSMANAARDLVAFISRPREDREISRNIGNLAKVLKEGASAQQEDIEESEDLLPTSFVV